MKKILSLALAGVMMFSALPVAYAADVEVGIGTDVTVTGTQASEYEITVPATLQAGGASGNVIATGTWKSDKTLIVTTADEVEVENTETGLKTMVPVVFDGINAAGNDLAVMSISKAISLEKGDILFGEWVGHIEYNVEWEATTSSFFLGADEYQFEEGMTWADWADSDYNNTGIEINDDNTVTFSGVVQIVDPDGTPVVATDKIIATVYDLQA